MALSPSTPVAPSPAGQASSSPPKLSDEAAGWTRTRTVEIFAKRFSEQCHITDRRFCWILLLQWVATSAIWRFLPSGAHGVPVIPLLPAFALGGAVVAIPAAAGWLAPGHPATRHIIAAGQMLFGSLLIHLTAGNGGTTFHPFVSLALLAFYRDWGVLFTATVVAALDQYGLLWQWLPQVLGIPIGTDSGEVGRMVWVLCEDLVLMVSTNAAVGELKRTANEQSQVEWFHLAMLNSKYETDAIILSNVKQGLLLITPDFRIGAHYSKAVESILGTKDLANTDFIELLKKCVPAETHAQVRGYLEQMFDPSKKERQIARANPLAEIELSIATPETGKTSKHLEFHFGRVAREGQISHLLVSINDAAERVRLQQSLKATEQKKQRQLDLLVGVLHVEPGSLQDFIESSQRSLESMATILDEFDFTNGPAEIVSARGKLDYLFNNLHAIKENATHLHLPHFQGKAQEMETRVTGLQHRPELVEEDLHPLTLALSEFQTSLEETLVLLAKLTGMRRAIHSADANASQDLLGGLAQRVHAMAMNLGKDVSFVSDSFDGIEIPEKYRELFQDIVVQLARNALLHGIEAPEERESRRKTAVGVVQILPTIDPTPGTFEFVIRDDGRGLSPLRLQNRAVEMGIVSLEQVASWEPGQLAALVFERGFTGSDDDANEGHGMGMELVKTRVVDENGGEIRINSTPGQFCEFHVILPA